MTPAALVRDTLPRREVASAGTGLGLSNARVGALHEEVAMRRSGWVLAMSLALVTGSAAHAQVPDPPHSVVPSFIRVVGSLAGVPDPYGQFTIRVRDFANQPLPFAPVRLEFGACFDSRICAVQANGLSVDCPNGVIDATADANGDLVLIVQGAATNAGTTIPPAIYPGAGVGCISVSAGSPLTFVAASTAVMIDQNGALGGLGNIGSNALDIAIAKNDVGAAGLGAPYVGRTDYTQDRALNGADLSAFKSLINNKSIENCPSYCP
jgi:hypothetical protein